MKRVLIVDDSAFMRRVVTDLLEKLPQIRVAATARNGKQALEHLAKETFDLVVMDVEMPVMNGLETLRIIKQKYTVPVIMLSSLANQATTIEALELGAADFIEKPVNLVLIEKEWIDDFYKKIDFLSQKSVKDVKRTRQPVKLTTRSMPQVVEAVVIGASTGGPRTLLGIIRKLPQRLRCPVMIVQHMPAGFTHSFAQRLNAETAVPVKEVTDGLLVRNQVYLCPGDYHMTVRQGRLYLNQEEKLHGTRPAVDHLFTSAAEAYQDRLVGVLLTGMGKDGTNGMGAIQQMGGYTIAQDKDSSVVFGMPRNAIEQKVVDEVLSLSSIETKIGQIVG
jgi:two-component system chemotaxis response regulator CheB